MDQLRTALVWLQRQHFWVLSALAALIALGCWAKASSSKSTQFNQNQSTIKAQFTAVDGVSKEPFHPNDAVNEQQAAQTKKQAEDVKRLWQQLYDRQRKNVLTWPLQLSKEFRDYVEKLPFGAEIAPKWRSHYQNYVEGHFPDLPKIIDARPLDPATTASPGGAGFSPGRYVPSEGPSGMSPDSNLLQYANDYICEWLDADQVQIRDELNFPQRPSSLRIWITQEDLWVYETLLDVIAKTNQAAHASRMSNAAVKTVIELAVGSRAASSSRTSGRLLVEPPAPAATLGGPEPGVPPVGAQGPEATGMRPGGMGPGGMGPGGGPMTEEQERSALLWGRYLDAQGKPIPFGGAGGDPAAAPPDATGTPAQPIDLTVFGQEYKRLPVRMVLWMNERWLPYLISTCANQPLQIEVQEVRINPRDIGGTGPGGGNYSGGPGGGAGGGLNVLPEEPALQPFPTQPDMATVVIQGTIYIFNKPNPAILQTPGDQQPSTTASAAQ